MISKEEVQAIAALARISVSESEVEGLQKDISAILEYIGQIDTASSGVISKTYAQTNVMREDVPYTDTVLSDKQDALLEALPEREGRYDVVRTILNKHD